MYVLLLRHTTRWWRQFGIRIKAIRTNTETEYTNSVFQEFLRSCGIVHQKICVDTQAQNGVIERINRHLLEMSRSFLFTMNVPKYLWEEAVFYTTYLINRMPLPSLNNRSLLQILQGNTTHLCAFPLSTIRRWQTPPSPNQEKCLCGVYSG